MARDRRFVRGLAYDGEPSLWNCDDGGLIVHSGDQVRVAVTGMAR
jgi:hypothetical protein